MVVPNSFEESDISHSKTEDALGLTFFVGKNKELPEINSVVPTPPKKSFRLFFQSKSDMKFRLGFHKRREIEDKDKMPDRPSVRPSPEEAKEWAKSFQTLMSSKYGQSLFRAFLRREFSHENIEFWIAVEDYRKARQRKLQAKAQKIIDEFILPHAQREVNLDGLTKAELITNTSQANYTTFDQAQKRIQGMLEADAFLRFLQSDLYLELVHPEKYDTPAPLQQPNNKTKSKKNSAPSSPVKSS